MGLEKLKKSAMDTDEYQSGTEEGFLDWIDLDDDEDDNQNGSQNKPYSNTANVTDTVEEYEKGKVMWCPCGAGTGVKYGVATVKCYACKEYILIDRGAAHRLDLDNGEMMRGEEKHSDKDEEQSGLSDWM